MSESTSNPDDRTKYGGQAVVEGVMMRSPHYFAVACRRMSNQEIVIHTESVQKSMQGLMWLNKPFLRGTLALIDAFMMGYRALTYAANIAAADELGKHDTPTNVSSVTKEQTGEDAVAKVANQAISGIAIGATTVVALLLGFGLFWALPGAITDAITHERVRAAILEGTIRIALFLGYIGAISRLKNIQRVFEYHGAEHKAINALESELPLTVENARASSRIHPRCGTNFIFIVLMTAMVVFGFVNRHSLSDGIGPFLLSHLTRLVLLPVVAGIAFEILKWAGKNRHKAWVRGVIAPGLWLQHLTTREPDDTQIEVAIVSLKAVWNMEHGMQAQPTLTTDAHIADEPAAAVA